MMLSETRAGRLRDYLDERLAHFQPLMRAEAEKSDPIGLVYPYTHSVRDAEIAALISSSFAYGRRSVFVPLVRSLLSSMGSSPYEFVMSKGYDRDFSWFRYRFNQGVDIKSLLYSLRHVMISYGSLESAFIAGCSPDDPDMNTALSSFSATLYSPGSTLGYKNDRGFKYLLPSPASGSACKRMNMLLRWMFRKDAVDLGLWSGVEINRLVIPLDTHVHQTSLRLGLTTNKSSSWACAKDITSSLLQLSPTDPLKYDFLLFSMGFTPELL